LILAVMYLIVWSPLCHSLKIFSVINLSIHLIFPNSLRSLIVTSLILNQHFWILRF
jgi:hypothetical protein